MGHLLRYELLGNTKAPYNTIHTQTNTYNERGQMECLQNQCMSIILLQSETVSLKVILN